MSELVNVAIAGATGAVGEALIEILEERQFPVGTLHLLASERSAGKRIQFRGSSVKVERLDTFDFSNVQIGTVLRRGLGLGALRTHCGCCGLRGHRQHVMLSLRRRHTVDRA